MTNHELNMKAAVLVKSVGGKRLYIYPAYVTIGSGMNAPRWSPATSIEDAMGLAQHLPQRTDYIPSYGNFPEIDSVYWEISNTQTRDGCTIELWRVTTSPGDPVRSWHAKTVAEIARALTEAFIAAKKASK